jgi:phosphoribosyl 1,2-cyclic phosphodiesterase
MVFESQGEKLLVDCGLMFPNGEYPGVDIVVPDFTYLLENKQSVKGVVLTHAHEDHIGALPYLLKELHVPVYGTRLTLEQLVGRIDADADGMVPGLRTCQPAATHHPIGTVRLRQRRDAHPTVLVSHQATEGRLQAGVHELQGFASGVLEVDEPVAAGQVQQAQAQLVQGGLDGESAGEQRCGRWVRRGDLRICLHDSDRSH